MFRIEKIKVTLTCFVLFFSIGIVGEVSAATYYVSPSGSGTTCSDAVPCALSYGVNTKASSGDTIIAKSGTYNQTITVNKSNITIQGTLDAGGNRLSIIDPYVNISGGWVEQPSGSGIYTKDIGDYAPLAFAIDVAGTRYKIDRLCQPTDGPGNQRYTWYCSNAQTHLNRPDTKTYNPVDGVGEPVYDQPVNFWDGFEVLATSIDNGTVFIRFRGKDNVNNKTILAAPSNNYTITVLGDYVTIKNFNIRALKYGIYTTKQYTTIDNNKITLGERKIYVTNGYATITNNEITDRLYAYDYVGAYKPKAWANVFNPEPYDLTVTYHMYQFRKYGITADDGNESSTAVAIDGLGSIIQGNVISYMRSGIIGYGTSFAQFTIANNYLHHLDTAGLAFTGYKWANIDNSSVYGNTFENVAMPLRLQSWGGEFDPDTKTVAPNYAKVRVYGNKFWNPINIGTHIHFHYDPTTVSGTPYYVSIPHIGQAYFYHNSISGGNATIQNASYVNYYTPKGMGDVHFINNIFSSLKFHDDQSYNYSTGICAYNWISGTGQVACTSGGNNINNGMTLLWNTSGPHDFDISGSNAISAGIDISRPYTINGKTYSSLPGFSTNYYTGSKPDMGAALSTLNTQTCTSFTYSTWNECQSSNTQTRVMTSASPSGCTGGNPVLTQSCNYDPGPSGHIILKTNSSPTIDGNLGEYALANSLSFSPSSGGNTVTVRTLWNSEALYLGIIVTDTQLNASVVSRDGSVWEDDGVEWFIDTYNDGGGSNNPNAAYMRPDDYHGIVNILNAKYDSQGTVSGAPSGSWNGTWQSAVKINGTNNSNSDNDTGYSIEIKIPWTSIGYSSAPNADISVGMSFAVNDKDASGIASFMFPNIVTAFENASKWQSVMLSGTLATVDTTPPAPPIALMIQ